MLTIPFTIASGGTVSDTPVVPLGYRLVGLEVPTIDLATLTIDLSNDLATYRPTADSGGTANGAIGGAANTGNKFVAVPDALSRMTEGHGVRITAGAAQTGGARTIKGICARTEA